MIFGFDADDVIFDTSRFLMDSLKQISDVESSELKTNIMRGDVSVPEVRVFLDTYFVPAIKDIKAKEYAKEVIDKLRSDGNKVVIVTARGEKTFSGSEVATRKALEKNEIEVDEIIYDSSDKAKDCAENNIELFVDDSLRHCFEVREKLGIPVIGFLSGVNRAGFERSDIASVENWRELERILEDFIKHK